MAEKESPPEDLLIINAPRMDRNPPSCCCCLDVRSGTVFIGLCNLVIHACSLVAASRMMLHYHNSSSDTSFSYTEYHQRAAWVNHGYASLGLGALMFVVTLMLIYGAIMRRSCLLLPFFFLQVFDMALFMMGTAGAISYGERFKIALESNPRFAYHDAIAKMDTHHFLMMLTTVCLAILIVKAFLLSCVWNCYKHTKNAEYNITHMPQLMLLGNTPEEQMFLPSYEDIIKEAPRPDQAPPPPYSHGAAQ